MSYVFEICANSVQSCEVAQKLRADRVELCAALTEGGTTPSYGMIKRAREVCKDVALHVIIRPRGGDFLYSDTEFAVMQEDILMARELKVDGVVFGLLERSGRVDVERMEKLLNLCDGLNVTFHRAFDVSENPFRALEDIISLKRINRILTSGAQPNALLGADTLKQLNEQAKGRIILMAGAGVSPSNIATIAQNTGIKEFHFSGKGTIRSQMEFHHPCVFMGLPNMDEYDIQITSEENVKATMDALKAIE